MRTVIKIGTSTLAYPTGRLNIRRAEALCKVISDLKNSGEEIIIVSSGAIGMGLGKLGILKRPENMAMKQAAAAVGQCELMYTYDKLFSEYHHITAQLLISAADIESERKENFINTLEELLKLSVIPIINENDTVATEEIAIGDNDTLAAIVAVSSKSDLLILMSDVDGLYDLSPKNPEAKLIPEVREINENIMKLGGGSDSSLGTGGMRTKLSAAKMCMEHGCDMVIINGKDPDILYSVCEGKNIGTRFYGR